jgi:CRISPR-associated protein Csm5
MSKIKLETLTSVHIGSGETLQYGNDFVTGKSGDDNIIGIVDARKVMQLIGEENIDKWVLAIERQDSTADIVKQFAPNTMVGNYSKRIIILKSEVKPPYTLKEQIHNGQGNPYIPGSSIKGAIRTAVLASIINHEENVDEELLFTKNRDNSIKKDRRGNIIVNADNYEKRYLGKDPKNNNSDIFRFLQVGDAIFDDNNDVAIRMVNINERERQSYWDADRSQLIEAINSNDIAFFNLNLKLEQYELAYRQNEVQSMPDCMKSVSELFRTINAHTNSLVKQEIEYWTNRTSKDDSGKVDIYLEKIKNIKGLIESCEDGKSCVIRIGHGSGWRFITGAWTESFDNFKSAVVPASRPNNGKYSNYEFPKTRRVDDKCKLLGFVKLTAVSDEEMREMEIEKAEKLAKIEAEKQAAAKQRDEELRMAKEKQESYTKLISEANELYGKLDYELALSKFKEAAEILPERKDYADIIDLLEKELEQKRLAQENEERLKAEAEAAAKHRQEQIEGGLSFLNDKFDDGRFKVTDFKGAKVRIESWLKKSRNDQLPSDQIVLLSEALKRIYSTITKEREKKLWSDIHGGIWNDVAKWVDASELQDIYNKTIN